MKRNLSRDYIAIQFRKMNKFNISSKLGVIELRPIASDDAPFFDC
ncbi:hypothetical protein [Sphingobacterium yanglingense]|nr:hypothetical protein [Sphingobacterium yanglingense]